MATLKQQFLAPDYNKTYLRKGNSICSTNKDLPTVIYSYTGQHSKAVHLNSTLIASGKSRMATIQFSVLKLEYLQITFST